MLLLVHISLALLSLLVSTLVLFSPSAALLRMAGVLAVATLVTGASLVVETHAALVSACTTGLLYLGVVVALNGAAYYRLTTSER